MSNEDVIKDEGVNVPEADDLQSELAEAQAKLAEAEFVRELSVELTRSGVIDLEAALQLAGEGQDAQTAAEQLRQDKPYLFAVKAGIAPGPTAGVRSVHTDNSQARLKVASRQASQSGNRRDLYEYLRLRRALLNRK
ncbi:MAG: hypothetical protein JXM68_09620 [Sedimentisphaerales bacterium]|nr:hypothetical protein [Sedimentisphaerales bacterium]